MKWFIFAFCVLSVVASAQEFVWAVPEPVDVEVRQPVPNGTVSINYNRDGDKVAFTRVMIEWYGQSSGRMTIIPGNSGVVIAQHADDPQWDANGDPIGGEVREAVLESSYEGVPHYYSRRRYNADGWDGEQPFEKYLKKISKVLYLDGPKVLGKLIQMGDLEVAMLVEYQRRGLFQKETEVLVSGFLGLYKEFRNQKIGTAIFVEDPLAVAAHRRKPVTWAMLKHQ
ncbi:MAG TPA: hypothetical protein VJB93_03930 [Patescibacteria group bacterium]|nr:hypothetical protein [Patescibacteria group bacterium]